MPNYRTFLLGRRLLGRVGALVSLAFGAISPTLARYANEAKPYAADPLATLLLLWAAYVLVWTPGPLGLRLLGFYPKKLGSGVVGWAAQRRLPPSWRGPLLGRFAAKYHLRMDEAEKPLEQYESLQSLFTRRLKPGLRPQAEAGPGYVNSPVDGRIIACGRITEGLAIQAKGLPYRIAELLEERARINSELLAILTPESKNFGDNNFQIGGGQAASFGVQLDGRMRRINPGAAAVVLLGMARMRRTVGAEEETRLAAGRRLPQREPISAPCQKNEDCAAGLVIVIAHATTDATSRKRQRGMSVSSTRRV